MTWVATGTDDDNKKFQYTLTDPFQPTFCGDLPVYQEMDNNPKVLYYNFLKKLWQIGEGMPKCTKKEITESKVTIVFP